MKKFELPEMRVSRFSYEDVITTSSGSGETPTVNNVLTQGASGAAGRGIISDTVSTYSIGYNSIDMGA